MKPNMADIKKGEVKTVVLAYSGGLDRQVILRWLQDVYGCEVVTFTADLGQSEDVEPARAKAQTMEKLHSTPIDRWSRNFLKALKGCGRWVINEIDMSQIKVRQDISILVIRI